jgi:hypothetical protein
MLGFWGYDGTILDPKMLIFTNLRMDAQQGQVN